MCSICSLPTGQTSMQALHVVHAQAASSLSAKSSSGRGLSAPPAKEGKILFSSIALVDQDRRRAERLAGGRRGADVLAAVAHDAAIRIEQARPSEILQLRGTENFFLLEIHRLERAGIVLFQSQIDRREKQMNMLGARKIRQEQEDRAKRTPPEKMIQKRQPIWRRARRTAARTASSSAGTHRRPPGPAASP